MKPLQQREARPARSRPVETGKGDGLPLKTENGHADSASSLASPHKRQTRWSGERFMNQVRVSKDVTPYLGRGVMGQVLLFVHLIRY